MKEVLTIVGTEHDVEDNAEKRERDEPAKNSITKLASQTFLIIKCITYAKVALPCLLKALEAPQNPRAML